MLEPLAGRLKWERTTDGICVVIPARLSWGAARKPVEDICAGIFGFLAIFAIGYVIEAIRGVSANAYMKSQGVSSLIFGSLGYCIGGVFWGIIAKLFGKTVVLLSAANMAIERKAVIRRSSKEVFFTAGLHNLIYVEKSGSIPVQNKIGQNEIQFGVGRGSQSFASGITREEGEALIAKMNEI